MSQIEFTHKSSFYWPIIGFGTRTGSVAMRCRDPAGQSEFFVRVLHLKTFNLLLYCFGIVILQRVQNCLARVVLRAPHFSPSLPPLKQLHWLPVNYRIKFKLSTLTYRALAIHQPPYLASPCTFLTSPDNSDHPPHSSFLFPKLN